MKKALHLLISLMTDQVSSFTSKGLKAGFIGTGMNKKTVDAVMNGQYQLLFISPEALLESRRWRDILNCCICYRRKYIFPSPLGCHLYSAAGHCTCRFCLPGVMNIMNINSIRFGAQLTDDL